MAALPDIVDGQSSRATSPTTPYAAAWGDPAIVLACGVPRPAALTATSECFVVNGVGWLATRNGRAVDANRPVSGTLTFTTIGRAPYVSVLVPSAYQPAADPLVDVIRTIKAHTQQLSPCR